MKLSPIETEAASSLVEVTLADGARVAAEVEATELSEAAGLVADGSGCGVEVHPGGSEAGDCVAPADPPGTRLAQADTTTSISAMETARAAREADQRLLVPGALSRSDDALIAFFFTAPLPL